MRIAMAFLGLALSVSACKKSTKPTGDNAGSGSATVAGSGSDTAGSGSAMAGSGTGSDTAMVGSGSDAAATTMTKRAGNCPSTVFGSTTKAEVKGKTVVVMITSDDKDAIASIQRRAGELLAEKKDNATGGGGHDQKGTHGGGSGICPVHVGAGATAVAKNEAKGVSVTITPKDKVDELKTEVDARITKAAEYVKANVKEGDKGTQGGVGGGKGDHGGNHSGEGDAKGVDRKATGSAAGSGSSAGGGTGGGGGKGTGGGHGGGH